MKYEIDWILETRRKKARETAEAVHHQMKDDEAFQEAVRGMKTCGAQLLRARARGEDTAPIEEQLLACEKVKEERLKENRLSPSDLLPRYTCPVCEDTGRTENGEDCDCKRQLRLALLFQRDPSAKILKEETFENFDLSLFRKQRRGEEPESPYQMMTQMLATARAFTDGFSREKDRNLLLYGPVGAGKSYLCHAITRELIERGVPVAYQTAYGLQELYQSVRFAPANLRHEREGALNRIRDADLLVIDDLGTETVHAVSAAHFFEMLNDRLLQKKSTVISTNLELPEIERMYSPRVFSRIFGQYELYHIFGDDLRMRV